MHSANVLILGGTGAIGRYLVQEYLDSGYQVFVTSRKFRQSNEERLNYLLGDAQNYNKLEEWLSDREYHVLVDLMVYNSSAFSKRLNLFSKYEFQYIFVSSYRVFSDSKSNRITENTERLLDVSHDLEFINSEDYSLEKARQEDLLRESCLTGWTIVRPSISYAKNRFQLGTLEAEMFIPRAMQGLPVILPREIMDLHTTMTWAGDVAKMISKLTLNVNALNNDFNVVTNEAIKWKQVFQIYQKELGLKVVEVAMDEFAKLGLSPCQMKYDRMLDRKCDNYKVLSVTDMLEHNFMRVEEGIKKELISSRSNFGEYSQFTVLSGRMDRILGIWQIPSLRKPKEFIRYYIGRFSALDFLYKSFS